MGHKKCRMCKERPANKFMSHHHLMPRYSGHISGQFHSNRERNGKTPMCKSCHDTIHWLFTNEELYKEFNTLEKLKEELINRLIERTLGPFMFLMLENGNKPV